MSKRGKKIKSVTFLGNFGVDYSSESDYLWTMKEKLHLKVEHFQEGQASAEEIEASALKTDAFFWVHTHGWATPGKSMKEVIANLKAAGKPTFGYHLDLWLGLEREKELEIEDYWGTEYFFTVDKLMADYMNERENMPKAFWIRPGVVERDCVMKHRSYEEITPADMMNDNYVPKAKYDYDVVFIGSKGYHPEWSYRPELIDWLRATYGDKFTHIGGDGIGVIRGEQLNQTLVNTKVVVGDSLCIGFDYPYYVSDRLYEITGRGGFLIFPEIKGVRDEFTEDELITYKFGDFDDLKEKIDYYLTHEYENDQIRWAGHTRTKEEHTYTQRLKEIFKILENEHYTA